MFSHKPGWDTTIPRLIPVTDPQIIETSGGY